MKHCILLIILILCAAPLLKAEDKADRFWTRARLTLTMVHGGTAYYDLDITRRALRLGFRERNPFLRPIIGRGGWQGQARGIGYSLALDLGISYLVHRVTKPGSPWRILKWQMPVAMSTAHTIAGVYNHRLVNAHLRR